MDDNPNTTRRTVLEGLAASGALAVGGIGIASADHGGNGGNRGGGDKDHGRGGGNGGGGGGGTNPTGGSALLVFEAGTDPNNISLPSPGDTFAIPESYDTGDTFDWWAGCDAAGSRAQAKSYQGVSVSGLDTSSMKFGEQIFVVPNRPIVPSEQYQVAEDPGECGLNTTDDDIDDTRYGVGRVYKFGWEPGEGEDH